MSAILMAPFFNAGGWNWREITSAGSLDWRDVSLSENGQIILAAPYGSNLRLSTDSGASWVSKESSRDWLSCDMSGDGTKQFAAFSQASSSQSMRISNNSGGTWANVGTALTNGYIAAALSGNGTYLLGSQNNASNEYIQISINGGANWNYSYFGVTGSWWGLAVNDSGHMIACGDAGLVTSTNAGTSWTNRTSAAGTRNWRKAAISSSGQIMVASVGGASGGYIYRSVNGGASWTALTAFGSRVWWGIAMSSDGQTIAANNNEPGGQLWLSEDGGDTASVVPEAGVAEANRRGVDISSDGKRIVTAVSGGSIYYGERL